jgi:hypothetical protein
MKVCEQKFCITQYFDTPPQNVVNLQCLFLQVALRRAAATTSLTVV